MKIVTVLGNRPHFIKHAMLSRALRQEFDEVIIHTGQHFDKNMSSDFFTEMGLPDPHYSLGVSEGRPHQQIGRMVSGIGDALLHERPDIVLVHGDTSSSLAGALAANKLHIPIAHVEAGVRCGDRSIPEEMNRILIDEMSQLLLCPTTLSFENLSRLGRTGVWFTGDVLYDLYLSFRGSVSNRRRLSDVVVTVHREDNTDDPRKLSQIVEAVIRLGENGREVIFPIHPRTAKKISNDQRGRLAGTVDVIEPVGHAEMLALIAGAKIVITDSGGVQREAYFSQKPCVYIGSAGWRELERSGASMVVPADAEAVLEAIETFMKPEFPVGIFGDGKAVERVVEAIKNHLKGREERP